MNKKAVFEDENGFLVFPAGVEPTAFRLGVHLSLQNIAKNSKFLAFCSVLSNILHSNRLFFGII